MKNGIPCNDFYHTVKAKKDRIIYRFVTDDGNTPAACTIRLGDIDPATGERITDVGFFREYYRLVDHQIYVQGKETKNRLSLDGLEFDDGDSQCERKTCLSVPAADPFNENEPEEILRLREITAQMTDRQKDVYEALLVKHAGGKERISMQEIADKWGVCLAMIYKEKDNVIRLIREGIKDNK